MARKQTATAILLLLTLVLLLAISTGCGDDDDDTTSPGDSGEPGDDDDSAGDDDDSTGDDNQRHPQGSCSNDCGLKEHYFKIVPGQKSRWFQEAEQGQDEHQSDEGTDSGEPIGPVGAGDSVW